MSIYTILTNVPLSVLDMIFTYCSTKDILTRLERVCMTWLNLSKNTKGVTCWNNVNFDIYENRASFEQVKSLINTFKQVKSLIDSRLGNGNEKCRLKMKLREIRLLDITNVPVLQLLYDFSFNIDLSFPNINLKDLCLFPSLEILDITISQSSRKQHKMELPSIRSLKSFTITNNVTNNVLIDFIIDGDKLPLLQSLTIRSDIIDKYKYNLCKFIHITGNIQNLKVCNMNGHFDRVFKTAPLLRELSIHNFVKDMFHPNVFTTLEILIARYPPSLFPEILKFVNLRHLSMPYTYCNIFIKKMSQILNTELPFLHSITIQKNVLYPKLKMLNSKPKMMNNKPNHAWYALVRSISRLRYINGCEREKWLKIFTKTKKNK